MEGQGCPGVGVADFGTEDKTALCEGQCEKMGLCGLAKRNV